MLDRIGEVDPARRTPAIFEAVRRGQQGLRGLYAELEALKPRGDAEPAPGPRAAALRDGFSLSSQGARALASEPPLGPGLRPVPPAPLSTGPGAARPAAAGGVGPTLSGLPGSLPSATAAPLGGGLPAAKTPDPGPAGAGVSGLGATPPAVPAPSAFVAAPGVPLAPPFPVGGPAVAAAPAPAILDLEVARDELVEELRDASRSEREQREADVLAETDRARESTLREVEQGRDRAREAAQMRDAAETDRAQRQRDSSERMRSLEADQQRTEREVEVVRDVDVEREDVERTVEVAEHGEQGARAALGNEEVFERSADEHGQDVSAARDDRERAVAETEVLRGAREERIGSEDRANGERAVERGDAGRAERVQDEQRAAERVAARESVTAPAAERTGANGRGADTASAAARVDETVARGAQRTDVDPARPTGPEALYRNSVESEPESLLDDLYG